jgi:hypothetical protein
MIGPGRIAGDQVVADDLRAIARAQLSGVPHPFASEDLLRGLPVNRDVERPLLCGAPDFCSGSRPCENDLVIRANIIVPHGEVHDEAVHRR